MSTSRIIAWSVAFAAVAVGLLATAFLGDPAESSHAPDVDASSLARGAMAPAWVPERERCRCAARDLADYFEAADEVALARLVSVTESDPYLRFRMVLETEPWKAARSSDRVPASGDTVEYRTANSTAACGVAPRPEAVYILFASRASANGSFDVDSCSGTRIHRSASGDGPLGGFQDVPGRFVARQLDALGGLEALDRLDPIPDAADPEGRVLRGLLDLEPLAHGGVVRVFDDPGDDARVVATVDDHDAVVTREVGYEVQAAVVYGRADGWSRVLLTDGGSGWVAPDEAGTWFPYRELPVGRLAYLTSAWSGYLWPDPGAGLPTRVAPGAGRPGERPVEVLESRSLAGLTWFRVAVLERSPCEGPNDARATAGGWVPGYGVASDAAGLEPTVWYWSRGC